jgi:signal transduction histidine kinase
VVQQAMQRAKSTLGEARRAIQDLRLPTLEEDTLMAALGRELDSFSVATGMRSTFEVAAGAWDVEPEMAQDILRIMQEALSNVARHAAASHVLIRLDKRDGRLVAVVRDDGAGFDVQEGSGRQGRFGLVGMRERAERWGGVLRVTSAPGGGTEVVLELQE